MSETTMPAAEANVVLENEQNSYELAFHILPTVAEGEVAGVYEALKAQIIKDGGTITDEEAPERFELAYEIVKHIEGKNRKFTSAYFGWVRFTMEAANAVRLIEEVDGNVNILRHLLIKLTRVEEENPFRFHESIESFKMVTTIDEEELVAEAAAEGEEETSEEGAEASEEKEA
jgi:ribosomal protein S6